MDTRFPEDGSEAGIEGVEVDKSGAFARCAVQAPSGGLSFVCPCWIWILSCTCICTTLDPQEMEQRVYTLAARPPSRAPSQHLFLSLAVCHRGGRSEARLLLKHRRPCCVASVRWRR